ncbi:uncharacterized protein AMSG_05855 [Thecamonas trahens ATCC 50062]|uniref:Uncharacterized protein n=1 Tax=Thecamonas trahens ATCC 50062 TaxID=461836 RepID=A0A0L0DFK7_THETB|nr:hypothetical protein AMSG_05855 [Thecamonas trahens ATCC 50062]KNC50088.1 hypothetical protein AMSG_05855 [Thecamonas trahens ATCC 50062]|eukprot:XP_013757251.1 hypothetical protein AMSG_05855 [Thecamonas trahens ATCC 50062]
MLSLLLEGEGNGSALAVLLTALLRGGRTTPARDVLFRILRKPPASLLRLMDKDRLDELYRWALVAADDGAADAAALIAHHSKAPPGLAPASVEYGARWASIEGLVAHDPWLVTVLGRPHGWLAAVVTDAAIVVGAPAGVDALLGSGGCVVVPSQAESPPAWVVLAHASELDAVSAVRASAVAAFVAAAYLAVSGATVDVAVLPSSSVADYLAAQAALRSDAAPPLNALIAATQPHCVCGSASGFAALLESLSFDAVLGGEGAAAAAARRALCVPRIATAADLEHVLTWLAVFHGMKPESKIELGPASCRAGYLPRLVAAAWDGDADAAAALFGETLANALAGAEHPVEAVKSLEPTLHTAVTRRLLDTVSETISPFRPSSMSTQPRTFVSLTCDLGLRRLRDDVPRGGIMANLGLATLTWVGPLDPQSAAEMFGALLVPQYVGQALLGRTACSAWFDLVATGSGALYLAVYEVQTGASPLGNLVAELVTRRPLAALVSAPLALLPGSGLVSPALLALAGSGLADTSPEPIAVGLEALASLDPLHVADVVVSRLQAVGHEVRSGPWAGWALEHSLASTLPSAWLSHLVMRLARVKYASASILARCGADVDIDTAAHALVNVLVPPRAIAAYDALCAGGSALGTPAAHALLARFGTSALRSTSSTDSEPLALIRAELEPLAAIEADALAASLDLLAHAPAPEEDALAKQLLRGAPSPLLAAALGDGTFSPVAHLVGKAGLAKTLASIHAKTTLARLALTDLCWLDGGVLGKALKCVPTLRHLELARCHALVQLPLLDKTVPQLYELTISDCSSFVSLEPAKRSGSLLAKVKGRASSALFEHPMLARLVLEDLPALASLQFALPALTYLRLANVERVVGNGADGSVFVSFSTDPLVVDVAGSATLTDAQLASFLGALHASQPRRADGVGTQVVAGPGSSRLTPLVAHFPHLLQCSELGERSLAPAPHIDVGTWIDELPDSSTLSAAGVNLPPLLRLALAGADSEGALVAAAVNRTGCGLSELQLAEANATDAAWGEAVLAAPGWSALTSLTLSNSALDVSLLSQLVPQLSALHSLALVACTVTNGNEAALGDVLGGDRLPNLTLLNTSGTPLGALPPPSSWPQLTALNIAANGLDDGAGPTLAAFVASHPQLTSINLAHNLLLGSGVAVIASAIVPPTGATLTLNIGGVGLGPQHIPPLCDTLASACTAAGANTTIDVVLAGNDVDDDVIHVVASV